MRAAGERPTGVFMLTTPEGRQTLVLKVALVWLVCFCPLRAFAYGVYEVGIENGDAPELFSGAFPSPPPGPDDEGLAAIEGKLAPGNGDFADMFYVYIGGAPPNLGTPYHRFTPQQFTVTMVQPHSSPQIADPQLFLFDAAGHAVVGNDDTSGSNLQSTIPTGTITQSGVYILAVAGTGYNPTDADTNEMFTNNVTGLKTPTNASAVQAGWTGTHNQTGYYRLRFGTGTDYGAEHWVPEASPVPVFSGVGWLLLTALLGLGMCRRRA